MIPCNVALITIATLFYLWRDMYVPKRKKQEVARERVARLLWAVAAHDSLPLPVNREALEEPESLNEAPEAAFLLHRDAECRACGGTHTFHASGEVPRPAGSTYEFTCPSTGKSAWIWWLGTPEPADETPRDSVSLKWVPG